MSPRKWLTEELFIFATTLMPFANIDLLIKDTKNKYLITWRSDKYIGDCWGIPDGCLRMKIF